METLFFGIVAGLVSAYFAHRRGRRPNVWFSIGLLFGLFGAITLFLLPDLKKAEAVAADQADGPLPEPTVMDPRFQEWFFLDQRNCQQGPLSFRRLISAWREKTITADSYVWTEGMAEWELIQRLPLLLDRLR